MNKTEQYLLDLPLEYKNNKVAIRNTFRMLKRKKPKQLDNIVQALHEEAFDKINCLDCGNCCKTISPRITDHDFSRLAKFLKIKPSVLTVKYLRLDEDDDYVFQQMPCPFLMSDNACMVYEGRPKACREYPHTDQNKFFQVLNITEKNIEICPAVMEISKAIVVEFER